MIRRAKTFVAASSSLLAATAFSGLLTGCNHSSTDSSGAPMATQDLDKHNCKSQNECKGHGGCKTDNHACKGQNTCKGQGGCNTINPPAK